MFERLHTDSAKLTWNWVPQIKCGWHWLDTSKKNPIPTLFETTVDWTKLGLAFMVVSFHPSRRIGLQWRSGESGCILMGTSGLYIRYMHRITSSSVTCSEVMKFIDTLSAPTMRKHSLISYLSFVPSNGCISSFKWKTCLR